MLLRLLAVDQAVILRSGGHLCVLDLDEGIFILILEFPCLFLETIHPLSSFLDLLLDDIASA
jgi:hypothetical protein